MKEILNERKKKRGRKRGKERREGQKKKRWKAVNFKKLKDVPWIQRSRYSLKYTNIQKARVCTN